MQEYYYSKCIYVAYSLVRPWFYNDVGALHILSFGVYPLGLTWNSAEISYFETAILYNELNMWRASQYIWSIATDNCKEHIVTKHAELLNKFSFIFVFAMGQNQYIFQRCFFEIKTFMSLYFKQWLAS